MCHTCHITIHCTRVIGVYVASSLQGGSRLSRTAKEAAEFKSRRVLPFNSVPLRKAIAFATSSSVSKTSEASFKGSFLGFEAP